MTKITLFCLPAMLLITACSTDQRDGAGNTARPESANAAPAALVTTSRYEFDRPDAAVELHEDLQEISGLTVLADGRLGAVQDESGVIYLLDGSSGAVVERLPFGGSGDYEGIEQVGDRIYILRSDGTLLEAPSLETAGGDLRTIETSLSAKNDTEGLAYDASRNRLLIACKEDPGDGIDNDLKAIYAYDLASGSLSAEPVLIIDEKEVEDRFDVKGSFKPSALAVHPADNSVYVLSSTSRSLAVLDENGDVRDVWQLPRQRFEQPEALAFLPDGTLYIASEGGDGAGMLFAYSAGRN